MASLRTVPGYSDALEGLARVDAARGDLRGSAARLRRLAADGPPARALVFLAELEFAAGHPGAARRQLTAARAQFVRDREAGGLPDAEAVLLEASHGSAARAVRLGRRVWRAKPSIRSADALGWALTRAGRPREALAWARRAFRTGSLDPTFRLHAGHAAQLLGRGRQAAGHFALAVKGEAALGPAAARLLQRSTR
jgi:tetratricopeptide (TPR) repeat protein